MSGTFASNNVNESLRMLSIVSLHGDHQSDCGYCGMAGGKSKTSYGMTAERLSCLDYQALCDAGWRRSGTYCYKPSPTICCPQNTIRLDVGQFHATKQQRKVVRRFHEFLRGERDLLNEGESCNDDEAVRAPALPTTNITSTSSTTSNESPLHQVARLLSDEVQAAVQHAYGADAASALKPPLVAPFKAKGRAGSVSSLEPTLSSSAALQVSAFLAKRAAARASMQEPDSAQGVAMVLASALSSRQSVPVAAASSGHINFTVPAFASDPTLLPSDRVVEAAKGARAVSALPTHTFRVDMVPASYDEESFQLWKRYQASVHGDDPRELTKTSYTRFLCTNPLIREPRGAPIGRALGTSMQGSDSGQEGEAMLRRCLEAQRVLWCEGEGAGKGQPHLGGASAQAVLSPSIIHGFGNPYSQSAPDRPSDTVFADVLLASTSGADLSLGYGAFHQRYYLDGVLVAVAVVDILPLCLSSVYVYYEPGPVGRALQLGKLTALREIQWVQAAAVVSPRLHWYYMGFFVASCIKMRYKAGYAPSDVRCPVTGAWVPLSRALPILDGQAQGAVEALVSEEDRRAWAAGQRLRDVTAAVAVSRVPMLMPKSSGAPHSHPRDMVNVRDLNERGRALLQPKLQQWVQQAGPELGARVVVQL